MTLVLEECIKNSFDESLKDYIQSEAYEQEQEKIDEKVRSFRVGLSNEQKQQFNEILDAITTEDGKLALQAYMHGTVEGIALRNKVIANAS